MKMLVKCHYLDCVEALSIKDKPEGSTIIWLCPEHEKGVTISLSWLTSAVKTGAKTDAAKQ